MKKMRTRTAALVLAGLFLWSSTPRAQTDSTVTAPAPLRPVRALWIVRDALTSRAKIQGMLDASSEGGITDLLVQVRGRGDAYFPSEQAPVAPNLKAAWQSEGNFDPLTIITREAHARGMRVHVWLNVYLVWSKGSPPSGHVIQQHPEWVSVNANGVAMDALSFRKMEAAGTEGVYLEPGNCDVVKHFLSIVDEILLRYPVDGIHLDYVRYPRMNVGYSEAMRGGFIRKTGLDPLDLESHRDRYQREYGPQRLADLDREWHQFKADQVTALVRNVRALMDSRRPGLTLSAAVRPDPDEALYVFGQDWVRWVNQGWVDAVAPMMYSPSASTVAKQTNAALRRVPADRVWAGIAIYNQSVNDAAAKIQDARRKGIDGFAIFSYNSLSGGARDLRKLTSSRSPGTRRVSLRRLDRISAS